MNLAEIANAWDRFEQEVLTADGEVSPDLAEQHEALQLAERQKVDGLAIYVRALEGQALTLKALEAELAAKRAVLENRVKWLRAYALHYLELRGLKEVRGEVYRLCSQRNGGHIPVEVLVPVESLPDWACRIKREADTDAIRAALQRGESGAEGVARLVAPGVHLRIR